MSCIKCSCNDISSPETHPVKDFIRSLYCPYCNRERFHSLYYPLIVLLIFIVPLGLYLLIKWDPVVSKESEDKVTTLGYWIVAILWWILLGIIMYYKTILFRKNRLIKDLDDKFQIIDKLKSEKEKKDYHDFRIKQLSDEIQDSINHSNK